MAVVLLLGARGFIGRCVSDALSVTPGVKVVELVRDGEERAGVASIDILAADIPTVQRLLASTSATVLVNCAGRTSGSRTTLVETNVLLVARILDALERASERIRLVQIGSAAEYGRSLVGEPVRETAEAHPVSAYGVSKLAATNLVRLALDRGRIEGTVLRLFNPIGPAMPADTLAGSVSGKLRAAMAAGLAEIETGPLGAVRDFIDVRDVGRAVAAACVAPELPEPIINVGSGKGHPARDLVQGLARCFGYRGTVNEGSTGSARSSDVPWQVAEITVARTILSWEPAHDFASTCRFAATRPGTTGRDVGL